ncbi:MAG: SH3 domain-containing protein [Pseudomonadota bacterium]
MPSDTLKGAGVDWVVVQAWTASYPDPIQLAKGEPVDLDGREDVWDGHRWLWAKNRAGKAGWIPDSLIPPDPPFAALAAYDALELTCQKGELLQGLMIQHGWALCRNAGGQTGWVPMRNLRPVGRS